MNKPRHKAARNQFMSHCMYCGKWLLKSERKRHNCWSEKNGKPRITGYAPTEIPEQIKIIIDEEDSMLQKFEIWQPRWHDRCVLLADYKISANNEITFPKTPSMEGKYYISGMEAKTYPLETMKTRSGAVINMRAIPIDDLRREDEQ